MSVESGAFLELSCEILNQGYRLRCRTMGTSMFPLLRPGNVIQVEPVTSDKLRRNDVIVYREGNALVGHRLLEKRMYQGRLVLITRGDAFPPGSSEQIPAEKNLGRVVSVGLGRKREIRLNDGLGRLLGLFLAKTGYLFVRACRTLGKMKERYPRCSRSLLKVFLQAEQMITGSASIRSELPQTGAILTLGEGLKVPLGGPNSIRKTFLNYYNQL
jgi:hypothetical protein